MKHALTLISLLFLAPAARAETRKSGGTAPFVEERLRQGLERMANDPPPFKGESWNLMHAWVRTLTGKVADPGPLNKALLDYCATYQIDPAAAPTPYSDPRPSSVLYHLYLKPPYCQLLSPESKAAIENVCWRWVYRHSFLKGAVDAKGRPWPLNNPTLNAWMISGSENHDARQRSANLLSLQVLMKADAPYGPNAKLYDGHTVAEHYQEWLRWFPEFYRQRIREGLDCEIAHPSSYGQATLGSCYDIEDLADSPELKKSARDFLTIFWAKVACEFEPRTGIRASLASTRCYKYYWNQTGTAYWARSILHAYGWTDVKAEPSLGDALFFTSTYRPPEILRAIASDPARGPYMGTSRRFGRGTHWNHGIYQVVFDDGAAHNSHLRRDIWYTKDYTMSALSFDLSRDYIELVNQSRVMGVTFSHDIDDRLVVYAGNTPANGKVEYKMQTSNGVNGLLGQDCLIAARDPAANPESSNSTRVFVSDGALWENRVENDGAWFFTRAGDGYAAIRIAGDKGYTMVPSPWSNGYYLEFKDIWAPMVIQTGQAGKYDSFDAFKAAVKAKSFTYAGGKLVYTALNGGTYEYRSNSKTLPTINGHPQDLNPAMTYDFPYLKMKHGTDTATISYPGCPDLVIDCDPLKEVIR